MNVLGPAWSFVSDPGKDISDYIPNKAGKSHTTSTAFWDNLAPCITPLSNLNNLSLSSDQASCIPLVFQVYFKAEKKSFQPQDLTF